MDLKHFFDTNMCLTTFLNDLYCVYVKYRELKNNYDSLRMIYYNFEMSDDAMKLIMSYSQGVLHSRISIIEGFEYRKKNIDGIETFIRYCIQNYSDDIKDKTFLEWDNNISKSGCQTIHMNGAVIQRRGNISRCDNDFWLSCITLKIENQKTIFFYV